MGRSQHFALQRFRKSSLNIKFFVVMSLLIKILMNRWTVWYTVQSHLSVLPQLKTFCIVSTEVLETALLERSAVPAHAGLVRLWDLPLREGTSLASRMACLVLHCGCPFVLHGVYNWMLFIIAGVTSELGDVEPSNAQVELLELCTFVFLCVGVFMFWKVRHVKIMRREQEAM